MKKYLAYFLFMVMILGFAACSQTAQTTENKALPNQEEQVVDPEAQKNEREVALYFANNEYVQTGNEELEKTIAEKRIVEYGNISLEEAMVRELIKGPENKELSTGIPPTAKLLGVEVSEGVAYVNFAQEGMNGGSLQELLTIEQIVRSLTDLDTVDSVQFLLDGQQAETLMGHMSIAGPFKE
ncbi:MAG: GerMN domain-containing protein [Peptococcaceae bacterium]|nr:GerMN domain-containing protein [Peptococcaceae bacterium]